MKRFDWPVLAAVALLLAALAGTTAVAAGEARLWLIDQDYRAVLSGRDPRAPTRLREEVDECEGGCSARWRLTTAAGLAALARIEPSGQDRTEHLDGARRQLDRLLAERPRWAPALILSAHLRVIAAGSADAAADHDIAASYRAAGFLRSQAEWRLAFAARRWDALDFPTQAAVMNEALWYARLNRAERIRVQQIFAGTPPYLRLALRLPGGSGEELPPAAPPARRP